jgi:ADP-heptose:LPS heptosyltransferase
VTETTSKILVIKLGALGDFIQAAGPFAAIRRHHSDAEITLLTAPAFSDFAQASPWFDNIEIDTRPGALQIGKWLDLRRWLRSNNFSRVYDLQTSDRSGFYYKLFWPGSKPDWSGIAPGCSHPHTNQKRDLMHTVERQQEQLSMAGIAGVEAGNFSWIDTDISRFGLHERFALFIPGGATHRPAKRWPIRHYQDIAHHLAGLGIQPALLGGREEASLLEDIAVADPLCKSLTGKTTIHELFALAQKAEVAIGNDTGPMHAASASGCKTIVLYSAESDPALCAQRGPDVTILREDDLSDIATDRVIELLTPEMKQNQT